MNERKNLDRLFQEKFKDFEVAPPDFVWENIQEALQEKKKRRVIPLWFRLSGVAALLLLGGLLTTLFINDAENPALNAPAVVIDNSNSEITSPADAVKASPDITPVQAAPSASGTATPSPANNGNNNTSNNSNTAVASSQDNAAAGNKNNSAASGSINRNNNTNAVPSFNNSNNAVAHEGHNTTINKKNGKRAKRNAANIQQGAAVAAATNSPASGTGAPANANGDATTNANAINKSAGTVPAVATTTDEAVAAAKLKNEAKNYAGNPAAQRNTIDRNANVNGQSANEGVAVNNNTNTTGSNPANAESTNSNTSAEKAYTIITDKSIPAGEVVAETAVDSAATIVPENELEKLLQEKLKEKEEDKAVAENKKGKERWNIRPQVAPVFYNSLSDGSPINEQFSSNSKSYDNDLSYGLGINYAVTDRISIRSGINSVNLSYSTNDIAYYASLNGLTSNIGASKTGNIVIQNPGENVPDTFVIDGQTTQLMEGSMQQQTGYIEIPLEMSYALVNKKFGIDVIGGFSTLFLNQNNVSVISSTGMSTKVGEAQNLNDLHFSTNVGVGFKYKFWDSFQASFEPTFKYQVNAYSRDAGNFKPYFIGLYSGVSFSF